MKRFLAPQEPFFSVNRLSSRLLAAQALSVLGLCGLASSAWAECAQPAGELASVEGIVEVKAAQGSAWVRAAARHKLCAGDTITVRAPGRAAVSLRNEVLVRLDQNSTLTLREVAPDADAQLGLTEGIAHVISRWRKRLGVVTPFINALVDGTEFTVLASPALSRVVVAEGRVRATNEKGEAVLIANQAAEVSGADAPPRSVAVRPLDAVAWAIHYPQVVWLDAAQLAALPPEVAAAVQGAQRDSARGHHAQALATLQALPEATRPPAAGAMLAASHLALGQVDEARRLLEAPAVAASVEGQAVRSVLLTARNDAQALSVAEAAVAAGPSSSAAALARSYALQATRQLPLALAAAQQATTLDAGNPVAWARRAELELSSSQLQAGRNSAQTALDLDDQAHRARAMLGMAELLSGQTTQALATLDAAIAADPSDPLAHFAHGVAQIRQGRVAEGRQDVELAALLDPSNAELRAYLGRAYLEEDRSKVAGDQFELAKRLDPASPTPWFFEATQRLRQSDAIGALAASQQAQTLNGNRNTLRPNDLTAADRSARSTQTAQAFDALGMPVLALSAAAAAYHEDPLDPRASETVARELSGEIYAESARTAAWTQSMLKQPIGQWPIPPQFLAPFVPGQDGPRLMSLDESTQLFDRRDSKGAATVLLGSRRERGASVLGAWNSERTQLDLSAFGYHGDEDLNNDAVRLSGTRVHGQFTLTPGTDVHAEWFNSDRRAGEVYEPLLVVGGNEGRKDRFRTERGLVGVHSKLSPTSEWTALIARSAHRSDSDQDLDFGGTPFKFTDKTRRLNTNAGFQYSTLARWGFLQLGLDVHESGRRTDIGFGEIGVPPPPAIPDTGVDRGRQTYALLTSRFGEATSVYSGWRYARFKETNTTEGAPPFNLPDVSRGQGALGFMSSAFDAVRLRAAWFQTMSASRQPQVPLQPVLFNGFVRDPDTVLTGTLGQVWGLAADIAPLSRFPGLIEVVRHQYHYDDGMCAADASSCDADWRNWSVKGAWNTSLTPKSNIGAEYRQLRSSRLQDAQRTGFQASMLRTEQLKLVATQRLTTPWTLTAELERVRQLGQSGDPADTSVQHTAFWIANLGARLDWGRDVNLQARLNNVFDRKIRFEDPAFNIPAGVSPFSARRSFVLQAQWKFN